MKFFFKWINPEAELDLKAIAETDLEILDLSLSHREGEIALCQLTIPLNAHLKPHHYAVLVIEMDTERTLLFKGKLMDMPVQINDWQQRIELFAHPMDAKEQLENLRDQVQQSEDWDDLFVEPTQRQDPIETLEAIPFLLCWDRVTHQVSLSNLFHGKKSRRFDGSQILQDSLCVKITGLPKPYVNVSVVAEWIQDAQGELNVFPLIERKFHGHKINTLTANGLIANWPRSGQLLGRSGYSVVESRLIPTFPTDTGVLNLYPPVTEKITFSEENNSDVQLKRSWFSGKLKLGWTYRQRRREIVTFKLNHQSRLLQRADSKKLEIVLRLADISQELPSASAASFFETERGKKAVIHAIKIARCHLAASARGIEVVFKVPLEHALFVTLDESIEIHHPAFPTGCATGKLIGYKLAASFASVWAQLKVAISTGLGETELPTTLELVPETPIEGLREATHLEAKHFIEGLGVHNQTSDQIEVIQQTELKKPEDLKQLLHSYPTQIAFKLKDIRSVDVLERRFSVGQVLNWSAP